MVGGALFVVAYGVMVYMMYRQMTHLETKVETLLKTRQVYHETAQEVEDVELPPTPPPPPPPPAETTPTVIEFNPPPINTKKVPSKRKTSQASSTGGGVSEDTPVLGAID